MTLYKVTVNGEEVNGFIFYVKSPNKSMALRELNEIIDIDSEFVKYSLDRADRKVKTRYDIEDEEDVKNLAKFLISKNVPVLLPDTSREEPKDKASIFILHIDLLLRGKPFYVRATKRVMDYLVDTCLNLGGMPYHVTELGNEPVPAGIYDLSDFNQDEEDLELLNDEVTTNNLYDAIERLLGDVSTTCMDEEDDLETVPMPDGTLGVGPGMYSEDTVAVKISADLLLVGRLVRKGDVEFFELVPSAKYEGRSLHINDATIPLSVNSAKFLIENNLVYDCSDAGHEHDLHLDTEIDVLELIDLRYEDFILAMAGKL